MPLAGEPVRRGDFAFGALIDVRGGDTLYVADLPEQVYQNVARDDLSDLAVFDANGTPLPFTLRRRPATSNQIARATLPIFPVRSRSEENVDRSAMRVTRDAAGRLSEITTDVAARRDSVVSAYVIDASQVSRPISALLVEWPQGSAADTAMVQVTLEASDDLKTWRSAGHGVLSRLSYGGRTLEQRRLEPDSSAPYYRLAWANLPHPLELTGVEAELAEHVTAPLQWRKLAPVARDDAHEFDAGGPFPAERVRINLDGGGAVLNTRLYSRPSRGAAWQLRYAGPIYDLRINGVRFNHSELSLGRAGERYWRLEAPRGGAAPTLELGWIPVQIVFVGRGAAPYQLAFGRAVLLTDRTDSAAIVNSLLAQKAIATPAKIGAIHELGGAKLLQPVVSLPWRKWLVWLALGLGVAVLAWMANRLLRDLGAARPIEEIRDDNTAG